jgi:hypothetical protein
MLPPPFHRPHKILGAASAANLLASCNSMRRLTDQHHTIWDRNLKTLMSLFGPPEPERSTSIIAGSLGISGYVAPVQGR